jgi:hypothetical protein
MDSGYGRIGFSCDSVEVCDQADVFTGRTAVSGDIVLDLGFVALDGFQTDSGFVAHGQFTAINGGRTTVWIRAWRFTPPLSRRSGVYACSLRTDFVIRNHGGDFTDWTGQATVTETKDSTYLSVYLANSSGGEAGDAFVVGRGESAAYDVTGKTKTHMVRGRWAFGNFFGEWEDVREQGARFVGPLSCNRQ